MSNKTVIFILLLFFAMMGAMSLVCAQDLAEDIVNASSVEVEVDSYIVGDEHEDILEIDASNQDDAVLEASKKGTFTELQKIMDNAKKGSTIYLTKDYQYNKDFGSKNGIRITKSITIDGKGHTINGLEDSSLLLINKVDNVVLKNIVFKNGNADGIGSICVLNSKNVKFNKCHFISNTAEFWESDDEDEEEYWCCGGAVYMVDSNFASFVDCSFESNDVLFGSAACLYNCHDSSFKRCNFESNYAECGTVYLDNCIRSSFDGCDFFYNEASRGGAVFLENCMDSSFKKCCFESNTAEVSGGAIYLMDSSSSFDSCKFICNILLEEVLSGNGWSGGAIFSAQSVLNIFNSEFSDNSAMSSGGDISSQYSMVFLSDSVFYRSESDGFGGSLSFNNDYVQIDNCRFKECTADSNGGGAIYSINSILNSYSSKFESCDAIYGGAICSLNTDLVIESNSFDNDRADRGGGSIYSLHGSLTVDSSIFSYSYAHWGGVMYVRSPHIINNITNNAFLYSSSEEGGNILIEDYYDEFPESGNVYEDVYFVYGTFEHSYSYSCDSNVLTYVISNSNEYRKDLSFYNKLRNDFISKVYYVENNGDDNYVHIFDCDNPNNSTIFLNQDNYNNRRLMYDVGHFYKEFNESYLEINFLNFDGDILDYLRTLPVLNSSYSDKLNSSLYNILYFSYIKDAGLSLYPISCNEKNVTVFGSYMENPSEWICSLTPDDYECCKINGTFSFNMGYDGLFLSYRSFYNHRTSLHPVSLLNPDYDDVKMIPSKYCSLDYGYLTPVKDQDIGGNCWAFAGIATLETCLKKITGVGYDFSENNAKNLMAASSIVGLNIDANGGGYDSMFMGYLASWFGPVHESYDEYNPLSSLSPELAASFHIQDIAFLSPRHDSWDNDEFKYAIMNYGAVAVTLYWESEEYTGYHAVSIVGWDDDYYDEDCLGNDAEGAWIIKNSWGDEWLGWHDVEGLGYLSYEQKLSGEIAPYMHAYTFVFNDGDVGYQDIYLYDFAGFTDFLCKSNGSVYYKNKFIARDKEFLYAFSTYFEKPSYFTYSVRINGRDITEDENNNTIINSIHYSPAGYHTISLGYNLTLNEGDEFEIIIKLVNNGTNYVPVCQADEMYKSSYPSNVSFLSYDGQVWFDLYDLNFNNTFAYGGNRSNTSQVACINAFTVLWRNNTDEDSFVFNIDGRVKTRFYNFYQLKTQVSEGKFIKIDIVGWDYDEYERFENFLELNVNNKDIYYLKVVNGSTYLDIGKWADGYYKCSAQIKSNCFGSNLVTFDFVLGNEPYSPFSKLEEIINNASDGDVITLYENYCADPFHESIIQINKSLTIDGNGYILDGANKACIKIVSDCNVTFKNIRFKNGNRAIISNGNLTVINCSFTKNHANQGGGAIYSNGTCFISQSRFDSNYAEYGGAIYSNGKCIIENSIFNSNSVNDSGGAILSDDECIIRDSRFNYNYADVGGAISSYGNCIIVNSIFNHNSADFGGAFYSNNYTNMSDSVFNYNRAVYEGGSIYLDSNTISDFKNTKFYSNRAKYGGAVLTRNSTCNMDNMIFNNNFARDEGGAIASVVFSDLTISNSNFKDNTAKYGGTIISVANLNITDSYFKSNGAGEIIYFTCSYHGDYAPNLGNLYLKNNKMVSDTNMPAVVYDEDKIPYNAKLFLVFNKGPTIKGENAYLCQIVDGEGNTFGFPDVNVTISNQNTNMCIKVPYDYWLGSYVFNTDSLDYGTYKLTGILSSNYSTNFAVKGGVLYVVKESVLSASALTKVYGTNKKLTVTLKDGSGKAIANTCITIKLNGKTIKVKTNSKGKVSIAVRLAPKKYTATITFTGNTKYYKSAINVKVTVKKAKVKIKAKRKTFKLKTKVKKYTITLKNNLGKAMKKTVVRLKIKGKIYKAKTNSKGKATFKIKNLKKKGTFKASIKYKGSKYYKALTKKVKITVKK